MVILSKRSRYNNTYSTIIYKVYTRIIMVGIKIIIKDATDPLTGQKWINFSDSEDGCQESHTSGTYQSRRNCYPFIILIGKESRDICNNPHLK